jgi:Protein of unknown function (DUF2786)
MARNRQRDAEEKRKRAQQVAQAMKQIDNKFRGASQPVDPISELVRLIDKAAAYVRSSADAEMYTDAIVEQLVEIDGLLAEQNAPAHQRVLPTLEAKTLEVFTSIWERGWQPNDAIHVLRRKCSHRSARLAIFLIKCEAHRNPHAAFIPDSWALQLLALENSLDVDQVNRVKSSNVDVVEAPITAWAIAEQVSSIDAIHDCLHLHSVMRWWAGLAPLCDPPSRWSSATQHASRANNSASAAGKAGDARQHSEASVEAPEKSLATIRALLAKAEGTEFPAEAEVFAAKAQELMTRYSIDAAMLDRRHGDDLAAGVHGRRVHIDQPYAKEKVVLLSVAGSVNNVRVVYDDTYAMATALGFDEDLDVTDMLYTSLLVQASRALTNTNTSAKGSSQAASPAFRRAFWLSFAHRVGERLEEAHDRATKEGEQSYGTALVPLLKERSDAIDAEVDQLFGKTRTMKRRSVDAAGWHAGRDAADNASLGVARGKITK